MIFFLGCDVAKTKLDIALIDERGIAQWADTIPNNPSDIATVLLTVTGAYPTADLVCVTESTSCYHLPFAETCIILGIPCRIYNPLLTKQQIKATVRGKKTDKTDAVIIARLGLRGEGRSYALEPYKTTKYYGRSCQKLADFHTAFARHNNHLQSLLESEFTDESRILFDGVQRAIQTARKQLYKDMAASAHGDTFRLLQTIPGIGPYIAASLLGEIQDVSRFTNVKALVAYAGLDPKVRQSGQSLNSTGKLSKRGSSYLRHSLFIGAHVAKRYDPQFRALYDKKRSEGKSYTVATCAVARKLLTVIRAVWLSGHKYTLPIEYETKMS